MCCFSWETAAESCKFVSITDPQQGIFIHRLGFQMMGKSQHYCTDSLLITTEKTRMKAWKMYKMYKCVRVCDTQMATQRQRSLASAAHRFMFPAKYHYTKLIDEAAVNAAELMINTSNVKLCPVTRSVFLFSFQRRVHPAWSVACASLRNQAGIITTPPSLSPTCS